MMINTEINVRNLPASLRANLVPECLVPKSGRSDSARHEVREDRNPSSSWPPATGESSKRRSHNVVARSVVHPALSSSKPSAVTHLDSDQAVDKVQDCANQYLNGAGERSAIGQ
eukprot:763088-Hanusia_phi.AAC.1